MVEMIELTIRFQRRILADTQRIVYFFLRAVFAISSYMIGIFVFSSIIGKN